MCFVRIKSGDFNYQTHLLPHLHIPYVYVIVLHVQYLGMSPLGLTFSQAIGREHIKVPNCHLFSPQAGAPLASSSLNSIIFWIKGICAYSFDLLVTYCYFC